MPITNLTAMIIASRDDIVCTSGGPVNGKYLGWITLGPEDRYRPLINTEPEYDTPEAAKAAMEAIVAEIRQKERPPEKPKCDECGGGGYGIYGQPGNMPCAKCNP